MDEKQVRAALRARAGLRVGPQTARYVSDRFAENTGATVSLFAQDARTGVPVRVDVAVHTLNGDESAGA